MSLKDFKIIILVVFIYHLVANRLGIPSMSIGEVVYKYNIYNNDIHFKNSFGSNILEIFRSKICIKEFYLFWVASIRMACLVPGRSLGLEGCRC